MVLHRCPQENSADSVVAKMPAAVFRKAVHRMLANGVNEYTTFDLRREHLCGAAAARAQGGEG